ncbi:glycosyl transferase family 2 [Crinalium epipsammum PCC 9333]|uniref:Glycosyl transferase family 2 n=1 Tax=Crinalium epipsammum PCC 9333 TaxID=1173022 RepID=K9VZT3_9CYAN|nr:glycosyltransferase [Crinalium epipsammum]AFZ13628.1 glycosyl transferase family 2 [Crinalium epipsammum PCC 9333]
MKVSVSMTAYNREKFIVQTLESVLAQEVNFDYEIIIGEDCSTDKTRDIVLSFQEKYPDQIRVLLHKENLGLLRNFGTIIQACQGQYIALIDDDDYWTSPYKLQKQVDFLDNHPECTVCFHDSRIFYEDGSREDYFVELPSCKDIFSMEDLKSDPFIPTSSTMFRRRELGEFPNWFYKIYGHDWALHLLNAQYGKLGYINEIMSATRVHNGGDFNGRTEIQQLERAIHDRKILLENISSLKNQATRNKLAIFYSNLGSEYKKQGNLLKAKKCFFNAFLESIFNPLVSKKSLLRLLIKVFL